MDKHHNKETGHYNNCGFSVCPNKSDEGYSGRPKCKCRYDSLITGLSCGEKLCTVCWPALCKKNKWDYQLSKCANIKCDKLKLSLEKRAEINQTNIMSKIGVTPKIKYGHISYKRRRNTVYQKLAKKQQQIKTRSMRKSVVDELENESLSDGSESEPEDEEETEKEEESEEEEDEETEKEKESKKEPVKVASPKNVAEAPKNDKKPGKTILCVNGIKMELEVGQDGETIINLDV